MMTLTQAVRIVSPQHPTHLAAAIAAGDTRTVRAMNVASRDRDVAAVMHSREWRAFVGHYWDGRAWRGDTPETIAHAGREFLIKTAHTYDGKPTPSVLAPASEAESLVAQVAWARRYEA